MKSSFSPIAAPRRAKVWAALALGAFLSLNTTVRAADTDKSDPADAWREVKKACTPPVPPEEWREHEPSAEIVAAYKADQAKRAAAGVDKLKDFIARFPDDEHIADARRKLLSMLRIAAQLGDTNHLADLATAQTDFEKNHTLSADEKFSARVRDVQLAAMSKESQGKEAMYAELEKGLRELIKEFPDRDEPYSGLLDVAANSDSEKAKAIVAEILASKASDSIKHAAKASVAKLDLVGKPLELQFEALDGRKVDVAAMKGKVVLVDFWATWCGPCVGELPHVKEAYDKLHDKGFEIVGISFDQDKSSLEKFVAAKSMAWPQYFDGKGWQNKFGSQWGINGIPTMWLVDKKGSLRDMNGREDLAGKVEKLLAEQ
jgi:thiol-disulfide isomerase/thioredoxin